MTKEVHGYLNQRFSLLLESGWENDIVGKKWDGRNPWKVMDQSVWLTCRDCGERIFTHSFGKHFLSCHNMRGSVLGTNPHSVRYCSYFKRALGLWRDRHKNKQLHGKLWCNQSHAKMETVTKRNVIKGESVIIYGDLECLERWTGVSRANLATWAKAQRQQLHRTLQKGGSFGVTGVQH